MNLLGYDLKRKSQELYKRKRKQQINLKFKYLRFQLMKEENLKFTNLEDISHFDIQIIESSQKSIQKQSQSVAMVLKCLKVLLLFKNIDVKRQLKNKKRLEKLKKKVNSVILLMRQLDKQIQIKFNSFEQNDQLKDQQQYQIEDHHDNNYSKNIFVILKELTLTVFYEKIQQIFDYFDDLNNFRFAKEFITIEIIKWTYFYQNNLNNLCVVQNEQLLKEVYTDMKIQQLAQFIGCHLTLIIRLTKYLTIQDLLIILTDHPPFSNLNFSQKENLFGFESEQLISKSVFDFLIRLQNYGLRILKSICRILGQKIEQQQKQLIRQHLFSLSLQNSRQKQKKEIELKQKNLQESMKVYKKINYRIEKVDKQLNLKSKQYILNQCDIDY